MYLGIKNVLEYTKCIRVYNMYLSIQNVLSIRNVLKYTKFIKVCQMY